MRRAIFVALLLVLALPARRAVGFGLGDKGTSGAQFLKVAPGARPAAMGEAFAGVGDDIHSIYYNPAGLASLKRVQLTGSHTSQFQGISHEFAALAVPMLSWVETDRPKNANGVLGAAVYNLSVSGIERRGLTETDSPDGTFGASDFAYGMTYAYAVPEAGVSLGATAKMISASIDGRSGSAFAADLGGLYRAGRLGVGLGARNLGSRIKLGSTADPLPLVMFTGASMKFTEGLLGSVEVDMPRDNKASFGFGGEYRHEFGPKLFGSARGGYNSRHTDAGGIGGAAFGLGLGYNNFEFDFAFVPFGDLGNTVKYSLVVKF